MSEPVFYFGTVTKRYLSVLKLDPNLGNDVFSYFIASSITTTPGVPALASRLPKLASKTLQSNSGILDKVESPTDSLSKDTIILIDSTSLKYHTSQKELDTITKLEQDDTEQFIDLETWGDHFRSEGFKVIGGGRINDAMELDRKFGQDLAREIGFKIPNEQEFTDYESALEFVERNKLS